MAKTFNYSLELVTAICDRLIEGETLTAICRSDDTPGKRTVLRWRSEHTEFANLYADALDLRADAWGDELRELADAATAENFQVVRLQVDTRKWQMARAAPKRYGDRLDLNHSGRVETPPTLDLSDLSHAEKFAFLEFLQRTTAKRAQTGIDTPAT